MWKKKIIKALLILIFAVLTVGHVDHNSVLAARWPPDG